MGEVRSSIIKKINNSKEGDRLAFSQEELEYFITRWIGGNYNNPKIANIKFLIFIYVYLLKKCLNNIIKILIYNI